MTEPMVFTHQTWRFLAKQGQRDEALALLGVITSSLICYMYGMFSTNSHVLLGALYRLPCPPGLPTATLAPLVSDALRASSDLRLQVRRTEARRDSSDHWLANPLVLRTPAIVMMTFTDALYRGLIVPGRGTKVDNVLRTTTFACPHPEFEPAVRTILRARGEARLSDIGGQLIPEPHHSAQWQALYDAENQRLDALDADFLHLQNSIDGAVLDWYGVTKTREREMVDRGLPWEYANRRE